LFYAIKQFRNPNNMKNLLPSPEKQPVLHVVPQSFNYEVQREPVVISIHWAKRKVSQPYEVHALVQDASIWDEAWFNHYE
jgi:hypothetical protein